MALFNFTGEQRVDTPDLTAATNGAMLGLADDLLGHVLLPPGGCKIVNGFAPAAAAATGPVQVGALGTENVAFLPERSGAAVAYSRLVVGGQASQSVDITSFAAGAYTIYVRLARPAGVPQNRTFWAALDQVEQARLTNTQLVAGWEVRLESALPGPDWFAIGTATVVAGGSGAGNTVTVADQRPMYFTGPKASGGAPAWGSAADRAADLTDLYTTLDALKASIGDVKGRGLADWRAPNAVGLQVGSGFTLASQPTANQVSVGDDSFFLLLNGSRPTLALDGSNDVLFLDRVSGVLARSRGGVQLFTQQPGGSASFAGPVGAALNAPGYALYAQNTSSAYGTNLGLISNARKQCAVQMGTGFGAPGYLTILSDWSAAPTNTFQAQSFVFLRNVFASNVYATALLGDNVALTANARVDLNAPVVNINNQPLVMGLQIWAAGVYTIGQGITQFSGPAGLGASATLSQDLGQHSSILVALSQNLPTNAIINVSGFYNETGSRAGKVYQTSWIKEGGNKFRVACANANQDPEDNSFSFLILYGS